MHGIPNWPELSIADCVGRDDHEPAVGKVLQLRAGDESNPVFAGAVPCEQKWARPGETARRKQKFERSRLTAGSKTNMPSRRELRAMNELVGASVGASSALVGARPFTRRPAGKKRDETKSKNVGAHRGKLPPPRRAWNPNVCHAESGVS